MWNTGEIVQPAHWLTARPRSRHPKALPRVSMSMSGCFSSVSQAGPIRGFSASLTAVAAWPQGGIPATQETEQVSLSRPAPGTTSFGFLARRPAMFRRVCGTRWQGAAQAGSAANLSTRTSQSRPGTSVHWGETVKATSRSKRWPAMLNVLKANTESDLDSAFASLVRLGTNALLVAQEPS